MREVYFSVDIESDGPIPGPNSMLSYGCAAFDEDGQRIGTFESNLHLLPDATPDPDTMAWWGKPENAEAWKACRENLEEPQASLTRFVEWVETMPGVEQGQYGTKNAVFVAYPSGFDFTFVYWYMRRFVGRSPFSFSSIDVKTYAMAALGQRFRESSKKSFPKRWLSKHPHTHKALDDAIEQGELFMNMLRDRRARVPSTFQTIALTPSIESLIESVERAVKKQRKDCDCGPSYDFQECAACAAKKSLAEAILEASSTKP